MFTSQVMKSMITG